MTAPHSRNSERLPPSTRLSLHHILRPYRSQCCPHVTQTRRLGEMPPTQFAYPSPKRKRDQPPPVPLLNTTLQPATPPPRGSPPPPSAPDSPRNAVADQMRVMSIAASAAIPMSPLTPTDDAVRKKPRLDERRVDSGTLLDTDSANDLISSKAPGNDLDTITLLRLNPSREIPETPQSQPRILTDIASFTQPTAFVSSYGDLGSQQSSATSATSCTQGRSSSLPRPRHKSPSPSLSALTWQDSEITGHLADPATDPDDDGTGLNGIGFRPTPAIAYARSQKRRQQLNEWKARETREARAKRHERRRRGFGGRASREATIEREAPAVKEIDETRRSVKFAI
jgi:hypothetical protein